MAFGLSPRYIQDISLEKLTQDQFLVIAIEVAKKLNWNIGYISEYGFNAYTKFSMSSMSEEFMLKIENGVATVKSECISNQMTDWGKNKDNIKKFIKYFNEIKDILTLEDIKEKFEELKPNLSSIEDDTLSITPLTAKEKITGFLSAFIPTKRFFVTPILINLNIAIFILMIVTGVNIFLPDNESLMLWGANFSPITLEGEWWRLITNCFLHIGIFHLLMNMYALFYIGLLLEPYIGKSRFLTAYLLTGLIASLSSLWWHNLTISAGASGAIFGMYGVFLAMLMTNFIEKAARKTLLTSITIFVGYNLLNGLTSSEIDNAAHIGGLIGGLIIGYSFIPSLKKTEILNLKYKTIGILTVIVLFVSVIVYNQLPNDIAKYDAKMKKFIVMESMALEVFRKPKHTQKEKLLSEIKNRGIYYWNENIKLLNEIEQLDLPIQIKDKNKKLLQYCKLRIKSYELLYKSINENTDRYQLQIKDCIKQVEAIIIEVAEKKQ